MFKFKVVRNASGEMDHIDTNLYGQELLNTAKLNKGCAFTQEEREQFNLTGLLPYQVETLDQQTERMYAQYSEHQTILGKNIYLNVLHDYNETLFYKLVSEHLEEMLPVIYTPGVGEAVQRFSLEHRKPRGLYISYPDRNHIKHILDNRIQAAVDLSVVTDGEAVLGIGDQGIGGINISNAKLMVYTLCGGVSPYHVLPIQLDVGTNNIHLLNDPMYLGWRHERITGQEYDDFVDQFVLAMQEKFPGIFLHWEDFGRDNARRILCRYKESMCTFNGDMQGTAVVALACVLAGVHASDTPLTEHRIVILGAGTAGMGIADEVFRALCREGLSEKEAHARIWTIDKGGLLTTATPNILTFQQPYAHAATEVQSWILRNPQKIELYDVVKNVKPTILIGCSTAQGAFNEEIVKLMAEQTKRPIIMPLSNPTSLSEATPQDLIKWTDAKAIIATGSPFPDVYYNGRWLRVAQSNNALAFPGIGLGAIAIKAKRISENMLWAATNALAECSPVVQDKMSPLLPKLSETKIVSLRVATAVAKAAIADGLCHAHDNAEVKKLIKQLIWQPYYYPYQKI